MQSENDIKIEKILSKTQTNSLRRGKKFLVGLLDLVLMFLLSSMMFFSYSTMVHQTKKYKQLIQETNIIENELADIAVSSNLTSYVIDDEGNKYLQSIESIAHEYVVNQVYTSFKLENRDISSKIFTNSYELNIDQDICLKYLNEFRVENAENFNSSTELSYQNYKTFILNEVSNDINSYYDSNDYPLLYGSVSHKIYEGLVNNNYQDVEEYQLIKEAYQSYLEKCINDFMTTYTPYITTQTEYDNLFTKICYYELVGLFASYFISSLILYVIVPAIISKDHSTLFMKLFRLKSLSPNNETITFSNSIIRFVGLIISNLFMVLVVSFIMYDINTFLNILFIDFLNIFNLFSLSTLSLIIKICNMIFTLYDHKKKQTIVESLAKIIVYEDKSLQKIVIGNKEIEIDKLS